MKRYTGFILIAAIVFSIGLVFSRARAEISSATSDGGTTTILTATGAISSSPAILYGFHIHTTNPGAGGLVTLTDGIGGTTILTIPAHRYDSAIGLYQSDASLARGIQFATSIYAVDTMSGTTSIQGIYK